MIYQQFLNMWGGGEPYEIISWDATVVAEFSWCLLEVTALEGGVFQVVEVLK